MNLLDGAGLVVDGSYGPATAAAVLAYKQKRNIVNPAYQNKADNIVGRMTIAALDKEMLARENGGGTGCRLEGLGANSVTNPIVRIGFAISGAPPVAAPPTDSQLIAKAVRDSKRTRLQAIAALNRAIVALGLRAKTGTPLSAEDQRVFKAAIKWLNMRTRADQIGAVAHIAAAVSLLNRSLLVKNAAGADPVIKRVPGAFHGQTDANVEHGIECGTDFFTGDGPLCRRDVITHEFLHFLGVKHGGSPLNGPTNRTAITTPVLSLDSADNLAQLVSEITTRGGTTDSCAFGF